MVRLACEPLIEVAVTIDGNDVKEYEDPDLVEPAERTVTRYVEAVTGKSFEIRFGVNNKYRRRGKGDYLSFKVYIGGQCARGQLASKQEISRSTSCYGSSLDGWRLSPEKVARFVFGEVVLSMSSLFHLFGIRLTR